MAEFSARLHSPLDALAAATPDLSAARLSALGPAARFSFRARDPAVVDACSSAFGVVLPQAACRFAVSNGRRAVWLGPDEWMLVVEGVQSASIEADLANALTGHCHALVDVSHRSVAFEVSGPNATAWLNCFCPLDLSQAAFPVGMATRTIFGKAEIVLLRDADARFRIDVWRSFAAYVWGMLIEARPEFA